MPESQPLSNDQEQALACLPATLTPKNHPYYLHHDPEFEEFVADLFREMGYAVETTVRSGDHGIDLFLRKDDQLIAVQCKHWDAPVGEPVIRDFLGSLAGAGANSGYVITTGSFTSSAYSFAQDTAIKLIDLDALMDLVTQRKADVH